MGEACGRPAAAVHQACSNNHPLLGAEQADFVHADSTTATEADVITLGRRVLIIGLALALPLARSAAAQRRADAEPSLPPVNTRAIEAHLKYLADDLLEGRAPTTRACRSAARCCSCS